MNAVQVNITVTLMHGVRTPMVRMSVPVIWDTLEMVQYATVSYIYALCNYDSLNL